MSSVRCFRRFEKGDVCRDLVSELRRARLSAVPLKAEHVLCKKCDNNFCYRVRYVWELRHSCVGQAQSAAWCFAFSKSFFLYFSSICSSSAFFMLAWSFSLLWTKICCSSLPCVSTLPFLSSSRSTLFSWTLPLVLMSGKSCLVIEGSNGFE